MKRRENRLTVEEHQNLANEIYAARDAMMRVSRKIWPAYKVSSAVAKLAGKSFNGGRDIQRLRNELDNCFFREHPGVDASPYYDSKRPSELGNLITEAFKATEAKRD